MMLQVTECNLGSFSLVVLSNSAVDVACVVMNATVARISRIKTVLFRESNFFAEKELLLLLETCGGLESQ